MDKLEMMNVVYVDYKNKDFQDLCVKLDEFQNNIVPARVNLGFTALAGLANLHDILMVYDGKIPIACASLKKSGETSAEVARVYTDEAYRGQGIGTMLMIELEKIAAERGYKKLTLDTWKKSAGARALYAKMGYVEIPMFDIPTLRNLFSIDDDGKLKQIQDLLVFMEKEIN
ncbi:MAG: GNAT family N-acetyltransferase [Clostridiales bacterium]|jgi:GNAT superfamily N-acetyltransferase|nr:GNAT family N-acetyltransferase [Clostridiales bacterium]